MAVTIKTKSGVRRTASLMALALVGGLAPAGSALAQDDHHGRGGGEQHAPPPRPEPAPAPRAAPAMERGGNWHAPAQWNGQARQERPDPAAGGWPPRGAPPNYAGHAPPAYRGQPAYQGQPVYQGQRGDQPRGNGAWHGDGGQWRAGGDPRGRDGQWHGDGGHDGQWRGRDGGQWSHDWRQDNRYDWRDYREANREAFHVGRYYAPYRDYYYSRLGIGFYLQPLFFGSDYWISDPWDYRLPPAYGPYHWVRYYDDVILVNVYTGQVADVIYDFFW